MREIVRDAHLMNRGLRRLVPGEIESVIGRLQTPRARALPFMGVAKTLALRFANLRRFAGLDPHDRIRARNVRKLELIDADFGLLRRPRLRVIQRRQVLAAADPFELRILVAHPLFLELRRALLRRERMLRNRRIALAQDGGVREYGADVAHLLIAQVVHLLQLLKEDLILLAQGRLRLCSPDEQRANQQCSGQGNYLFSVR